MEQPKRNSGQLAGLDWAQFGLGGLVIAALFATLFFFHNQHAAERKQWRVDFKELVDRQEESLDKLTARLETAIKEASR